MKKVIFSMLICIATTTNAQKISYKVGIMTGIPVGISNTNVAVGSTFLEATKTIPNKYLTNKFSLTLNSGYVRLRHNDNNIISQVPVLIGAKYGINKEWYFGAAAGVTIPTNGENTSAKMGYSPYIGFQRDKISVDARYYVSGLKQPISTLALVFSYKL